MNLDSDQYDEFDEYDEVEEPDRFEKFRQNRDGVMPVRGAGSTIRGQQRHLAARNPRRRPCRPNGIHRRRIRKYE